MQERLGIFDETQLGPLVPEDLVDATALRDALGLRERESIDAQLRGLYQTKQQPDEAILIAKRQDYQRH